MMAKVYEFHQACIWDLERQIDVQKIYVNSGHPVTWDLSIKHITFVNDDHKCCHYLEHSCKSAIDDSRSIIDN
jgi:hypothetical protein